MAAGLKGVGPRVALTLVATVALTVVVSAVGGSAGPWGTSTTTSTSTTSSTTQPQVDGGVAMLHRCFGKGDVNATLVPEPLATRLILRRMDRPAGCSEGWSLCTTARPVPEPGTQVDGEFHLGSDQVKADATITPTHQAPITLMIQTSQQCGLSRSDQLLRCLKGSGAVNATISHVPNSSMTKFDIEFGSQSEMGCAALKTFCTADSSNSPSPPLTKPVRGVLHLSGDGRPSLTATVGDKITVIFKSIDACPSGPAPTSGGSTSSTPIVGNNASHGSSSSTAPAPDEDRN